MPIRDRRWTHDLPELMPGLSGAHFDGADEQQQDLAHEHVRADAFFASVVDASDVDGVLQIPVHALDLVQPPIPQHHVLGGEVVVAGVDQVLPIQLRPSRPGRALGVPRGNRV
jgi:hypothetical protein